jgi:SPP1 family phage portal protein
MYNNQAEIIKQIKDGNVDNVMLHDLIDGNKEYACGRMGIYNRFKLHPASIWEEDISTYQFDGVPIFKREIEKSSEKMKVNHKLHLSSDRRIIQTFVGYLSKPIQIVYSDKNEKSEERKKVIDEMIALFMRNNDSELLQSEIAKNCSLLGVSYLLLFINNEEINIMTCDPWETIVIKNNLDQVEYAMRYWKVTITDARGNKSERYKVEFYDDRFITYYIEDKDGKFILDLDAYPEIVDMTNQGVNVSQPGGKRPHFFMGCPIIEIPKNKEKISDVEITLPLQDALDISESDLSSEVSQLRLAYLMAKMVGREIDNKLLQLMKQTGILPVDNEKGEWSFIEKNINVEAVKYLIDELKSNITKYSNSVDFSSKDFQDDIRVIGWGIKMKPLEESAIEFENNLFAGLRRIFALVFTYWGEIDSTLKGLDRNNLSFTLPRNLPQNIGMETDNFVKLFGKVSNETALSTIPSIVKDIPSEIKKMEEETSALQEQLQGFQNNQNINQNAQDTNQNNQNPFQNAQDNNQK